MKLRAYLIVLTETLKLNIRRRFGFLGPFYSFEEPTNKSESKSVEHNKSQKRAKVTKEKKSEKKIHLDTKTKTELNKDSNHT